MAAVTVAILVKSVIMWSVSDRDDRDTPADCRRCAWLAAHAAAGCSAPSSVQPQVLHDLGWERGCCACLWSKGGWGWGLPLVGVSGRETNRDETLVRDQQRKDRKKRAGNGESQEEGEDVLQSPHEQRLARWVCVQVCTKDLPNIIP